MSIEITDEMVHHMRPFMKNMLTDGGIKAILDCVINSSFERALEPKPVGTTVTYYDRVCDCGDPATLHYKRTTDERKGERRNWTSVHNGDARKSDRRKEGKQ